MKVVTVAVSEGQRKAIEQAFRSLPVTYRRSRVVSKVARGRQRKICISTITGELK